jgi:GNAT superfamily N-acetyltransferase
MSEAYEVVFVEHPEEAAWGIIGRGLDAYNKQQAGDYGYSPICFVVRSADGDVVGGVIAQTYWDWLYIDLMWVREDQRGRGYGSRLLTLVEDEARKRGARHVHLDTFSFQAPDFYLRHGYQTFGVLDDYPNGHQRFYLTKAL